jgi:hypothetical protein
MKKMDDGVEGVVKEIQNTVERRDWTRDREQ